MNVDPLIGCRPINPNKKEDNGLFSPLAVSHIREFHSNLLDAYFKGEVYLWSALLYFNRTKVPRCFLLALDQGTVCLFGLTPISWFIL